MGGHVVGDASSGWLVGDTVQVPHILRRALPRFPYGLGAEVPGQARDGWMRLGAVAPRRTRPGPDPGPLIPQPKR